MPFIVILSLFFSLSLRAKEFSFTILHTNDLHSFVAGFGPSRFENDFQSQKLLGHYARLSYLINEERFKARESNEAVITVDAGDFFSGTFFHTLAPRKDTKSFPEFEFFKYNNYDATTLGNHEFDAYNPGLGIMLEKMYKSKIKIPVVSSNVFLKDKDHNLKDYFDGPKKIISKFLIKEFKSNGEKFKVGFIGLLGPDGCLASRGTRQGVGFNGFKDKKSKADWDGLYEVLRPLVKDLKTNKKVDVVVALMHGGFPEDKNIALEVPGIDVIIAGHTHKVYREIYGHTIVSQAGSFGRFLGILKLKYKDGLVALSDQTASNTKIIDSQTPVDRNYLKLVKGYKKEIDRILSARQSSYDEVIFTNKKNLSRSKNEINSKLGKFLTTSILSELNNRKGPKVDLYFTTMGLVRSGFEAGETYLLADIFKKLPIGFNERQEIGSPIVSFYLTRDEVLDLVRFLELYSHVSKNFTPAFSENLNFSIRKWAPPFLGRIKKPKLNGLPFDKWPQLIHVSTSRFVANYVDMVDHVSYGIIKFVPKNANGIPLKELFHNYGPEYLVLGKGLKRLGKR